ncbi:non-ribosomal peptide synthetase [uncultured Chitinophaga sp.]|uniref:non-ribosomal peptide synthetase n=1 Tax=uncultured Chitinophaga sp. TaxID=339340 RepID=UPI002615569D|nr:non-ribosomal peptide synthetase [uncultured Chitinophaga sp.]
MNISQLLTELNEHDITLSLDEGDLLIDFEGESIAEPLINKIKENKGALVAYLKKYAAQQDFTEIHPAPQQESYPVSFAQKRLWILSQYPEVSKAYIIPNQVELSEELNMEHFRLAIHAVADRHEILRTVFREDQHGEVRQWILPEDALNIDIQFLDFSMLEQPAAEADMYIEADGFKAFDLANGPLFRMSLIKLAPGRYRFYYIMHHIISDGWSLGVLIRDVLSYYHAYRKGVSPNIPPLEIQYKDYACWQLSQLEAGKINKDKDYWHAVFADDIPLLEIPGRPLRPAVKTNRGELLETWLSKATTARLKQFTQAHEGSLFITLLSLWNALLYRYTEQEEIVMGTAVAGRDHAGLEDQIGFYVNTLALRNRIDPTKTFADLYAGVRANALEAFSHQSFPFDLLVESLQLQRDNSRNPLFDVMLTLLSSDTANSRATVSEEQAATIRFRGKRNAKFDIEINGVEAGPQLQLIVNYNADIYDEAFVSQLLRHFSKLTEAVLDNPHLPLSKYDLLLAEEREQLLHAFNNTARPYPDDKTVIQLFEAQVRRTPGSIAVSSAQGVLTYAQLNAAANQLGHYLREQYAIGADDLVGIELSRTPALIIAIYGVLKAGGAYVPLDPANPADRKAYIKADAGCKCTIDEEFMARFNVVAHRYSNADPVPVNDAGSLVYVIYTSGSTGAPKGVMIEHRSLVNRLVWMQHAYPLKSADVILQKTTYSFDVSVWELLWWSMYGASVHLLEPEGEKVPSSIVQSIATAGVTVMHFVPAMLSSFLGYLKEFPEEKKQLRSLKQVFTSGEALSKDHRDELLEALPRVSLMNLYGPTEASIDVTYYDCKEQRNDHIIPIGKPIFNTQLYVLDQHLQLSPVGVKGHLYIAGTGLARGYVNNEALTRKKFIPHPFRPGHLLYDTGDVALWLPDGNIHFLGRADDQVKIRGFRIELGEIEYHIRRKEGIDDAVVLVRETVPGQKDLVAFIVSREAQEVSALRNYLADKVPHYMVPAHFVQVDSIPLNASGKANRKQLLALDKAALADKVAFVAPRNEKEKALIAVCEAVLNRRSISIKENFYNLGGDSIKSIQMVSRLKQAGYTLKVEDILRTPVLEALASLLVINTHQVDQSPVTGVVALTPIQHYFFENTPVLQHFNQSILLKSQAPIDLQLLDRCLKELLIHHDALRMVFTLQDGVWRQFNNAADAVGELISSWDLSAAADPLEEMKRLTTELQAAFDLSCGPLLKAAHFRLADGERLAIIIHHLVTDGISWRILIEDLLALYQQYQENNVPVLPAKTDSYQRWASLQQEYANSGKILKEAACWTSICEKDVPVIRTDHPHSGPLFLEDKVTFSLDEQTTRLLQTKFHTIYNTEVNDVLLTGLGLAISEVFGQQQVVVKMEGHGREEIIDNADISRTVGWFTTMYPFILEVESAGNAVDSLIRVKEDLRKIPNKGIGYGMLKYLNKDYHHLHYTPSVLFNFLGDFDTTFADRNDTGFSYATEAIGPNIARENTDEVLLNISGSFVGGRLYIGIMYAAAVYDEDTIARLQAAYKKHLAALIETVSGEPHRFKTPSDLTYRDLSMQELAVLNAAHNIEDVYELSPLQLGIYYHWLRDGASSQYVEQISYRIQAKELSIPLIHTAYERLVERYAVLRTGFAGKVKDFPLQVVRTGVQARFFYEEIPAAITGEDDIADYIKQYKTADRNAGFKLADDSLMRLKILRVDETHYEFIWSHHHILMDGWCMSILIQDFNRILQAVTRQLPPALPAPKPYADYIRWLMDVDTAASLDYWKNYLDEYTQAATLPFVKSKPGEVYREGLNSLKVEGKLLDSIQALCSELGITQSTFLQTAWGFLLSKYNHTNDVVFGAVVSGRPAAIPGIEQMVGLFINTIPVRIRYEQDDTLFSLLKEVQDAGINSNAHHYLNLAKVQAQSELGAALINHIMVFENFPVKDAIKENADTVNGKGPSLSIQQVEVFEQTNYDLDILVLPSSGALQVNIRFNAGRYEEDAMAALAIHFYHVIEQFATSGNKPLNQVSFLPAAERTQILDVFNATTVAYAPDTTVLDLFRERVAEQPDQVAVRYQDAQLSYRELDERSGQLAYYLRTRYHVGLNDLVGIQLERSISMLVVILGILKAGGAYVPIDTACPEERWQYIRENSQYKVCIDAAFLDAFQEEAGPVLEDAKVPLSACAYAIYTSGSTGQPKGVLNDHAGLYNRLLWMRDNLHIGPEAVILQKTPYTFDVSVWELLMPGITGSKLVFAAPEGHKDPAYLQSLISREQVSIVHFVPSMLGIFLEELDAASCRSLQHVVCSGEALSPVLVAAFKEKLPWVRLHNLYGPTEAAIDVTAIDLTEVDTNVSGVSIGKPVANTRIYIVDRNLQLQPVGVPGELLIEGVQVARGYLNQAALSAEKFIASPFTTGGRAYRTGDLAKWLPNGEIAYMGRMDDQVKIRGNRIEPGEIETRLLSYGLVEQAAVVVKGEGLRKYLVAYVLPREGYSREALYNYLSARLPEYMIPGIIMELESFPLTSSGKLNRRALPEPQGEGLAAEAYEAPRNEMESSLAIIWQEVLGLEKVGIHDNFFRIGGDSIISIRLISRINRQFNAALTIGQLYQFNTIAALSGLLKDDLDAAAIWQSVKQEITGSVDRLREQVLGMIPNAAAIEDIYPMSDIQKGMVILSALNPEAAVYHDQFTFTIPKVNPDIFREAFTRLTWKHPTLRTRFDLTSYDQEVQIVDKEIPVTIGYQDISNLDKAAQEQHISNFMLACRQQAFNVMTGPLWRADIFSLSPDKDAFLFRFHHAILDGWSVASLNTELFKIYRQLEKDPAALTLEKLQLTNRDAIIAALCEKQDAAAIRFWQEELADYKRLQLFENNPCEQSLTKNYDFRFKYQLEEKCRTAGLSVKTVIYGAFVYVLKLLGYEDDFIIGMVTNNRPLMEDGDKLLGCFLNTIPARNRLEDVHQLTWDAFFKNLEAQLTRLKSKERLTLYEISKVTNENATGGSPFFDIMYNYVDFHIYDEISTAGNNGNTSGSDDRLNVNDHVSRNTALDLNVNLSGKGLQLIYNLRRTLIPGITLEKMQECLDHVLSAYLDAPDRKTGEISFLPAAERTQILDVFNATTVAYAPDTTVLDLFRERVAEQPDQVAVRYQDAQLSYRELDERSGQLAYYLRTRYHVGLNDLVGIQLERSISMLVVILGILKAGGAYVPIDTACPEERWQYIRENSQYKVCIDAAFLDAFQEEAGPVLEDAKVPLSACAYAIYTSGSTGQPKGVLNDHAGLYNRLLWMRDNLHIGPEAVILQKTPYTFDVSVWELLMPGITGSKLVFAAPEGHKDPAYLQSLISREQVSIVHFVPSMLGIFLEELDAASCRSLQHVVCSGEALSPVLVAAFKEKLPWVRLHNLYGPTEAAIDVTAIDLTEVDTNVSGVSIGKPVANTRIYIVDRNLQLQPVGVPGELLIEGVQVARGYLNQAALSAEKFIASPFTTGGRAYRTGDLAKWLPNGEIAYMGRMDDQVKIRGNRIEPGEIETRLLSYGLVEQAAVVVKGEGLRKYLVAYVLPREGYSREALYNYLSARLPEYMIPGIIMELESFPLTSSGKLNRRALPEPQGEGLAAEAYEAPRNEMESSLAIIWQEVLGLEKVGIHDNFFRIGGDSIISIRLISRINRQFNAALTIGQLYQFNTIAALSGQVQQSTVLLEEKKEIREDIRMSFDKLMDEVLGN